MNLHILIPRAFSDLKMAGVISILSRDTRGNDVFGRYFIDYQPWCFFFFAISNRCFTLDVKTRLINVVRADCLAED